MKSVVVPWMVESRRAAAELSRIFSTLGFQDGESWSDAASEGVPHLAPLGAIEVIHGTPPAPAELIVEVNDLTAAVTRLRDLGTQIVCEPYDSHWQSRVCVAQVGGRRVAFFEFK